ncbi:LuxR C-terminal-related transcriptional regulator [Trinickia sp. NRRL B-1857]|uniref:LuxR C-terminal-related transcriptional regulator n=1 Tax=Trinickia sp. NRRL B-1857 TaxID=3162879 RepID=UPI003D27637A
MAAEINLSEFTVKIHRGQAMRKMESNFALARMAGCRVAYEIFYPAFLSAAHTKV